MPRGADAVTRSGLFLDSGLIVADGSADEGTERRAVHKEELHRVLDNNADAVNSVTLADRRSQLFADLDDAGVDVENERGQASQPALRHVE